MLIMIWILPFIPHSMWGFKYFNLISFSRLLGGYRRLSCVPAGAHPEAVDCRNHWESELVGSQRPYKFNGAQSTSLRSHSLLSPLLLVPLKFILRSSLHLVFLPPFSSSFQLCTLENAPLLFPLWFEKLRGGFFFSPHEILPSPFWKISLLNESLESSEISGEKLVRNKPVQRPQTPVSLGD